ncbi:MAG: hypothetical protein JWN08_3196 [Frankiales bacterium]|nr:hypothetical protein [Frankiales bacterium]
MTGRENEPTRPDEASAALLRDDDAVPMQLSSSWDQAEARLYPAVTTRPDLYQRVLTIVARTVERLRGLGPSTGALLAAAERGSELVSEVMVEHGLSAYELDLDLLAGAALAMRHREVAAEQAARRRLRLVAEGHRAGRRWVVLEERGHSDGDPFMPYQRLEVEVGTGRALLVTARGDDEFRTVLHGVEELRVDLTTGALEEAAAGGVAPTSHPGRTEREAHVAALQSEDAAP